MRPTGTIPLSTTTPEINPQSKPKQHSQVPSAPLPVMLEAQLQVQLQVQPRPTSLPAPQDLPRTEPLIFAAVNGRHAGQVATLPDTLNPPNDKQFDQTLEALRKAISINCVPVAKSLIDWFKEVGAFDAGHNSPLEHELKNFSHQELLCLAKAGYEFSYNNFPAQCEEKTVSAIQDIMFGEGLKQSPLSLLSNDPSSNSDHLWLCISQCGMLDENGLSFDAGITKSDLLLQGFRLPVAIWLTELLACCSPQLTKTVAHEDELSDSQVHLFGLTLLNAMQSPPPQLHSSDPLVGQQCALLAKVAQHSIQVRFNNHEKFFGKCLSCLNQDFSIDTQKLKKLLRSQLGLPNSAIKQIDSALEQCLDLPLDIVIKTGITARRVQDEIFAQTRLSLLRLLPKVLLGALQSHGCLEEIRNEIQLHGKAFEVFSTSSILQLKQLCQQMQIAIESDEFEFIDLSSTDESSEPASESDSAFEAEVGESSSEEATDPKPDTSHS